MTEKIRTLGIRVALVSTILGMAMILAIMVAHFYYVNTNRTQSVATELAELTELYGVNWLNRYKDNDAMGIAVMDRGRQLIFSVGYDASTGTNIFTGDILHIVRLSDGSILKFTFRGEGLLSIVAGFVYPVGIVMLLVVGIGWYMSKRTGSKVLEAVLSINPKQPLANAESMRELYPLLRRMDRHNRSISKYRVRIQQHTDELAYILDNVSDAIIIFDNTLHIVQANKRAKELLGCGEGEYYLDSHREYRYRITVENAFRQGKASAEISVHGIPLQMYAYRIEQAGTADNMLVFFSEQSDAERVSQLRREFSANVSHELKTPLTSIMGNAELLCSGLVNEADIDKFYERIYTQSKRLLQLIDDIIKLSRLDEGEGLVCERLNLLELARSAVEQLEEKAEKRAVKLSVSGENVWINGCYDIVFEIVFNLCDNAIMYNRESGGVDIDITSTAESAVMTVTDTGIGIATEDIPHVFERFYRADKSHTNINVPGTGLGLSIVKHAVKLHGGDISVQSRVGRGSVFTVTIPVAQGE